MPELIDTPTRIPVPGGKVIDEFVGRLRTGSDSVSVARMTAPAGWDDIAASWAAPDALLRRVDIAPRLVAPVADRLDARKIGPVLMPGSLAQSTAEQVARAESPTSALALLMVSPDFLRR